MTDDKGRLLPPIPAGLKRLDRIAETDGVLAVKTGKVNHGVN